jgi:hypothetical protein
VNTWYSFDGNTKTEVVTERVNYTDEVSIGYRDKIHVLQLQQFYYHLVIQVLLNNLAAE